MKNCRLGLTAFRAWIALVLLLFGFQYKVSPVWALVPEVPFDRKVATQKVLGSVYGDSTSALRNERRAQALEASTSDGKTLALPEHMTTYGELGIDALVTLMDAMGVQKTDRFLDIGSGDFMLVAGAALLFAEDLQVARGVEILPSFYERSLTFQKAVEEEAAQAGVAIGKTESYLGDVFRPTEEMKGIFQDTTLSVCFATTWSKGIPGRRLDALSAALGSNGVSSLPKKSRLVIIDGVLDEKDGFVCEGELKLACPDTAPYSIARLYVRS